MDVLAARLIHYPFSSLCYTLHTITSTLYTSLCEDSPASPLAFRLRSLPEYTHKHVAKSVNAQRPNSVHPIASTVKDCRHRDIVGTLAQFFPVRVLCIIPAAVPCVQNFSFNLVSWHDSRL